MKAVDIEFCPEYFYRYIHKTDDLVFQEVLRKSFEELNFPTSNLPERHLSDSDE